MSKKKGGGAKTLRELEEEFEKGKENPGFEKGEENPGDLPEVKVKPGGGTGVASRRGSVSAASAGGGLTQKKKNN